MFEGIEILVDVLDVGQQKGSATASDLDDTVKQARLELQQARAIIKALYGTNQKTHACDVGGFEYVHIHPAEWDDVQTALAAIQTKGTGQ